VVHTRFWAGDVKEPLGRPRCRWDDNIKMKFREMSLGDKDWI